MEFGRYRFPNEKSFNNLHLSVKFDNLYKRSVEASSRKPSRHDVEGGLHTDDAHRSLRVPLARSADIATNKSESSPQKADWKNQREDSIPDELRGLRESIDDGDNIPECLHSSEYPDEPHSQCKSRSPDDRDILSSPIRHPTGVSKVSRSSPVDQSSSPCCDIVSSPVRPPPDTSSLQSSEYPDEPHSQRESRSPDDHDILSSPVRHITGVSKVSRSSPVDQSSSPGCDIVSSPVGPPPDTSSLQSSEYPDEPHYNFQRESRSPDDHDILSSPVQHITGVSQVSRSSPVDQSSSPGCDIVSSPVRLPPDTSRYASGVDEEFVIEISSESEDVRSSPVRLPPAHQPLLPSDLNQHDGNQPNQAPGDGRKKPPDQKRGTSCPSKEKQKSRSSNVKKQSKTKENKSKSRKRGNKRENTGLMKQLTDGLGVNNSHPLLDASSSEKEDVKSLETDCNPSPHEPTGQHPSAALRERNVKGRAVPNKSRKPVRGKTGLSNQRLKCRPPTLLKENVRPPQRKRRTSLPKGSKAKIKKVDGIDEPVANQTGQTSPNLVNPRVNRGCPERHKSGGTYREKGRTPPENRTIKESRTCEKHVGEEADIQCRQDKLLLGNDGAVAGSGEICSLREQFTSESHQSGTIGEQKSTSTNVGKYGSNGSGKMRTIELPMRMNLGNMNHSENSGEGERQVPQSSEEYDITFVSNSSDEASVVSGSRKRQGLAKHQHWNILPLSEAIRADTRLPQLHFPPLFGRGGMLDVTRNRVWRSVVDENE